MGPLITQGFITEEWHYVIALILGIAFGLILEQAGFSSSRKLAGLFYGYDFVVLHVFFTAAITAMLGLLFFSYFGWIDLAKIWVNPLYLPSAIVGGIIMGFGFIIGGFCPGTSVCAIGIGKIDAMAFVAGIFIGAFIFGLGYPAFEDLHKAGKFGHLKLSDYFGISDGVFALIVVVLAIAAFYVAYVVKQKITPPEDLVEQN